MPDKLVSSWGEQALALQYCVTGSRVQAEADGLRRCVEDLDEEVQLSRRAAAERQQENDNLRSALRVSQEEAEALQADAGRSNFRLRDLQQTVTQLQVQIAITDLEYLSSACSSM